MSGNSRSSSLHDGADRQRLAGAGRRVGGSAASAAPSVRPSLTVQVGELVLADLELVAVLEPVRLDPAAVHVGAVERAEVVDVEAVAARARAARGCARRSRRRGRPRPRGCARSSSARPRREGLAGAAAAGADHQRAALVRRPPRCRPPSARRSRRPGRSSVVSPASCRLGLAQERAALLAVVRALGVDEAALRAVHGPPRTRLPPRRRRDGPCRRGCRSAAGRRRRVITARPPRASCAAG